MTYQFAEVRNELKSEIKELQSSKTSIPVELRSVITGMGFVNENFEEFKTEDSR